MQWVHLCPGLNTPLLFNQYFMFDVAKYSLGDVRLELTQGAVFAAATSSTDWSQLNSTPFSFHSAGKSARSSSDSSDGQHERHGSASSQIIICKSWNRGHCVAPSASCRFAHKCSSCHGPHRAAVCPADTPSKLRSSFQRFPHSPPPRSSRILSCVDAPHPPCVVYCY